MNADLEAAKLEAAKLEAIYRSAEQRFFAEQQRMNRFDADGEAKLHALCHELGEARLRAFEMEHAPRFARREARRQDRREAKRMEAR